MKTITTQQIVNVLILLPNNHTKICKVIKVQLFTMIGDIKHHLIGNIYYKGKEIINVINEY
jgi:hypothetical protein